MENVGVNTINEEEALNDSNNIRYPRRCRLSVTNGLKTKQFCLKEERSASLRTISAILQKSEEQRSTEEAQFLNDCSETVEEIQQRRRRREEAKRRLEEIEDPEDELYEKCNKMAQAMIEAQHIIVYTGAGISTAAKIPDYRGPNGIWTKLQQGKDIGKHDLSSAEPTYTHMALSQLYHQKILKHVVSQNCDGLHLRSGLPRSALSELHGNMLIEVCKNCRPSREYLRPFDVTENTARFSHKTMRKCYFCNSPLIDTIVHFGERGTLYWPLNWRGACKNAKKATMIICLGSSLKVLKKYPWLWQMDKPVKKRPTLFIVNLQWTPKDDWAFSKIHGKCDTVMRIVMNTLGIHVPDYDRKKDPVFFHWTNLCKEELHTTTRPFLQVNDSMLIQEKDISVEEKLNIDEKINVESFLNEKIKTEPDICTVVTFKARQPENHVLHQLYLYPFLTSYMYSGLHSIITPPPLLNNLKEEKTESNDFCKFCWKEYQSPTCLFYRKFIPFFASTEKNVVCLCCDNITDNESVKRDNELKNYSILEKNQSKTRITAGWFGKGYSKNRKRRKS
ncbi:NAD-dependent protein deacetylase sirtuin-7 isoform X2 [Agrilus planipennis]|uniref:protein acetyllysine N-acetyltransferase n=1 Tax=Agrilus planipennis TaxID=224129 RepID=A0A1W4XNU0_AGRPL|nr:NAD-dependent protein deacetylase sirtuin-7 isoform X2 [Agrilus planipennis]